ncbi:MAG: hypothetical protein AABY46_07655 [Nitrospirota bacterium]
MHAATASAERESDVPALHRAAITVKKHKKITAAVFLAVLGIIAGVLQTWITHGNGGEAGASSQPALSTEGEDGVPERPMKNSQRITALETRTEAVETAVGKMGEKVEELVVKQAVMVERVSGPNGLTEQVQRANSDNAGRFDKIVDKLDRMRDAEAARGRVR